MSLRAAAPLPSVAEANLVRDRSRLCSWEPKAEASPSARWCASREVGRKSLSPRPSAWRVCGGGTGEGAERMGGQADLGAEGTDIRMGVDRKD